MAATKPVTRKVKEKTAFQELSELCMDRLVSINLNTDKRYVNRLYEELKFIKSMDRQDFILAYAKGVKSGEYETKSENKNGLLFAFLLNIVSVDPIKEEIPHNKYLGDPPDIDIDLSDDAKAFVEKRLTEKYGQENVLHVFTLGKFLPKSSIKDVCRTLALTNNQKIIQTISDFFEKPEDSDGASMEDQVEYFNNTVKPTLPKDVIRFLDQVPEHVHLLPDTDRKLTNSQILFKYATRLAGQIRQNGRHASGTVISTRPFTEFAPMKRINGELVLALQEGGGGKEVSLLGCLKYDWLGLTNASKHVKFYDMVQSHYGFDVYNEIIEKGNLDDDKAIEVFNTGETLGVFQFGSDGMRKALRSANIKSFQDVVIMNAFYRPATMGNLPVLFENMWNPEAIKYDNEFVKPILEKTYGLLVYQEQVMQILQVVGNFTGGEADKARGILKKLSRNKTPDKRKPEYYEYAKMLTKFRGTAKKKGMTDKQIERYVEELAGHASYSFNKAHATSYSMMAYVDAYVKAHFPLIFYKVLIDYKEKGDNISEIIADAKVRGVVLTPFDINKTSYHLDIDIDKNQMLLGFKQIKGLRVSEVEQLIELRRKIGGEFLSLDHFFTELEKLREKTKKIPSRSTMVPLIQCGAFDGLLENRRLVEEIYHNYVTYVSKLSLKTESKRWDWNDIYAKANLSVPDYTVAERIKIEFNYLGLYLFEDPIEYGKKLALTKNVRAVRISDHDVHDSREPVIGIIEDYKSKKTKNGNQYLDIVFTDMENSIKVKVWSDKIDEKLMQKGVVAIMQLTYQETFNSFTMQRKFVLEI